MVQSYNKNKVNYINMCQCNIDRQKDASTCKDENGLQKADLRLCIQNVSISALTLSKEHCVPCHIINS